MTQFEIDQPGRYFPVDVATLPTAKKAVLFYNLDRRERFIDGDRSECIPGEAIIAILRKQAKGKGITVMDRTTRVITRAGVVLMGCLALLVAIQVIIWWVKP